MKNKSPCTFCSNKYSDPKLHDTEDFSDYEIGSADNGYRLSLSSSSYNNKQPVIIEVRTAINMPDKQNHIVAFYAPQYCPECGRYLHENQHNKKEK